MIDNQTLLNYYNVQKLPSEQLLSTPSINVDGALHASHVAWSNVKRRDSRLCSVDDDVDMISLTVTDVSTVHLERIPMV